MKHRCAVVDCTDDSIPCICLDCHFYSTGGRVVKLSEPCEGKEVPRSGSTAWLYFQWQASQAE
eukprot:7308196-Pyramimonas_sp.AAC.1